jgi:hypothetical protein
MDDVADLTERWETRWSICRPIGHELRTCAADRWVRFHSLPDSPRYAEAPAEYAEVLARHNTVISELFGMIEADDPPVALAVTCAWGDRADRGRTPDLVAADPSASLWRTGQWDGVDDRSVWRHLWVSTRRWSPGSMDALLTLVADGKASGVIIAPSSLLWLYHPYDGGADVIAPSSTARDRLAAQHVSWLSAHPGGL